MVKFIPLDIQFFGRQKNALTKHFVGDRVKGDGEIEYLRLAKWISNVPDDSDEEVDDTAVGAMKAAAVFTEDWAAASGNTFRVLK